MSMSGVTVFLSTTPDATRERKEIHARVLEKYSQTCRDHGIQFQLVDLHPGPLSPPPRQYYDNVDVVLQLMADNQQECACFIYLFGSEEGTPMLPTEIEAQTFQIILSFLSAQQIAVVEELYKRDKNLLPEAYVLDFKTSCLANVGLKEAWEKLGVVGDILEGAFKEALDNGLVQQEALNYLFNSDIQLEYMVCLDTLPKSKRLCLKRTCTRPTEPPSTVSLASDQTDAVSIKDIFLEKLQERDPESVHELKIPEKDLEASSGGYEDYISSICEKVGHVVQGIVDEAVQRKKMNPKERKLGDTHASSRSIVGLQDEMFSSVKAKLFTTGRTSKPLLIHGASGSGKSTLLHSLIQAAPNWFGDEFSVLSFDFRNDEHGCIIDVIFGICSKLDKNFRRAQQEHNIHSAASQLQRLCQAKRQSAMVIVLDHVESLPINHGATSFQWLPMILSQKVKFVVSLGTDSKKGEKILESVQRIMNDPARVYKIDPFTRVSGSEMILQSLKGNGKALRTHQYEAIFSAFPHCQTPLFIQLALNMAKQWHSFSPNEEFEFPSVIEKVVNLFFDGVELQVGVIFVKQSLGYLSAAKSGLSLTQLRDILALDRQMLDHAYCDSAIYVQLKKLLFILKDFLYTRTLADGRETLTWHAVVVKECAKKRYLKPEAGKEIHRNFVNFYKGIAKRSARKIDPRLVIDLPYHLASGELYDELQEMLQDVQWWLMYLKMSNPCSLSKDLRIILSKCTPKTELDACLFCLLLEEGKMTHETCCSVLLQQLPNFPGYAKNVLLQSLRQSVEDYSSTHWTQATWIPKHHTTTLAQHKMDVLPLAASAIVKLSSESVFVAKGNCVKVYEVGKDSRDLHLVRNRIIGAGVDVESIKTAPNDRFMVTCKLSATDTTDNKSVSHSKIIKVFRISNGELLYSGDGVSGLLPRKSEWHAVLYVDKAILFQEKKRFATIVFPGPDSKVLHTTVSENENIVVMRFKGGLCCGYDLKGSQVWNIDMKRLVVSKAIRSRTKLDLKISSKPTKGTQESSQSPEEAANVAIQAQDTTPNDTNGTTQMDCHENGHQDESDESEKENLDKIVSLDGEATEITDCKPSETADTNLEEHDSPKKSAPSIPAASHYIGTTLSYIVRVDNHPSSGPTMHLIHLSSGKHQRKPLTSFQKVSKLVTYLSHDLVTVIGVSKHLHMKTLVLPLPNLRSKLEWNCRVSSIKFSSCLKFLALVLENRLEIWSCKPNKELIVSLPSANPAKDLVVTDKHVLAVQSNGIALFAFKHKIKYSGPFFGEVSHCELTPNKQQLVVVSAHGVIAAFDLLSSKWVTVSQNVQSPTAHLATCPTHALAVSCSNTLQIFKLASDSGCFSVELTVSCESTFYSESLTAFIALGNKTAVVASPDLKHKTVTLPEHSHLFPSATGSFLVAVNKEQTGVTVHSLSQSSLRWPTVYLDIVPGAKVEAATFTSDESVLAVVTSGDDAVTTYNPLTGKPLASCMTPLIASFVPTSDAFQLAGVTHQQEVILWRVQANNIERALSITTPVNADFRWLDSSGHVFSVITEPESIQVIVTRASDSSIICKQVVITDFPALKVLPLSDREILCVPTCGIRGFGPTILELPRELEYYSSSQSHDTARSSIGDITLLDSGDGEMLHNTRNHKRSSMCAIL